MTSNCVSRVDAVNGAREIQNGSILSLYDTLRKSEERMYNNRVLTQSLIHKANLVSLPLFSFIMLNYIIHC